MGTEDIGNIYSKLNKLDVRLKAIEETRPFLKEMIERNIKSYEQLSKTLHEVQLTMTKLSDKMDEQSDAIEKMNKDFERATEDTNQRIDSVNKKVEDMETKHDKEVNIISSEVEKIEDKSKFDIMDFFRKNFPWIVVLLGLGIAYISTFIRFY